MLWEFHCFQNENADYGNRNAGQTDDLVSVRSDGPTGATTTLADRAERTTATPAAYMRNHRSPAPSFMRSGMHMNHLSHSAGQQTTRLMADPDGTVKHSIPHITTDRNSSTAVDIISGGGDRESGEGNGNGNGGLSHRSHHKETIAAEI
ncbi:Protein T06F4.1 a [Aphelenchoides avenae]|nr:Protein T06F4.1 a [Aphelenchus avenae]